MQITNSKINKIAKILSDAMVEKVREQGFIAEIMDDKFNMEEFTNAIMYYFGIDIIKDGRIYLHNCGNVSKDELDEIDSLCDLMLPLYETGEEDESAG